MALGGECTGRGKTRMRWNAGGVWDVGCWCWFHQLSWNQACASCWGVAALQGVIHASTRALTSPAQSYFTAPCACANPLKHLPRRRSVDWEEEVCAVFFFWSSNGKREAGSMKMTKRTNQSLCGVLFACVSTVHVVWADAVMRPSLRHHRHLHWSCCNV